MRKQQHIDHLLRDSIAKVLEEATLGRTICRFEPPKQDTPGMKQKIPPPAITREDWIMALQKKFPDSLVYYEDIWEDVTPEEKKLKKYMVVDWS